jgi:hypothetical protein
MITDNFFIIIIIISLETILGKTKLAKVQTTQCYNVASSEMESEPNGNG